MFQIPEDALIASESERSSVDDAIAVKPEDVPESDLDVELPPLECKAGFTPEAIGVVSTRSEQSLYVDAKDVETGTVTSVRCDPKYRYLPKRKQGADTIIPVKAEGEGSSRDIEARSRVLVLGSQRGTATQWMLARDYNEAKAKVLAELQEERNAAILTAKAEEAKRRNEILIKKVIEAHGVPESLTSIPCSPQEWSGIEEDPLVLDRTLWASGSYWHGLRMDRNHTFYGGEYREATYARLGTASMKVENIKQRISSLGIAYGSCTHLMTPEELVEAVKLVGWNEIATGPYDIKVYPEALLSVPGSSIDFNRKKVGADVELTYKVTNPDYSRFVEGTLGYSEPKFEVRIRDLYPRGVRSHSGSPFEVSIDYKPAAFRTLPGRNIINKAADYMLEEARGSSHSIEYYETLKDIELFRWGLSYLEAESGLIRRMTEKLGSNALFGVVYVPEDSTITRVPYSEGQAFDHQEVDFYEKTTVRRETAAYIIFMDPDTGESFRFPLYDYYPETLDGKARANLGMGGYVKELPRLTLEDYSADPLKEGDMRWALREKYTAQIASLFSNPETQGEIRLFAKRVIQERLEKLEGMLKFYSETPVTVPEHLNIPDTWTTLDNGDPVPFSELAGIKERYELALSAIRGSLAALPPDLAGFEKLCESYVQEQTKVQVEKVLTTEEELARLKETLSFYQERGPVLFYRSPDGALYGSAAKGTGRGKWAQYSLNGPEVEELGEPQAEALRKTVFPNVVDRLAHNTPILLENDTQPCALWYRIKERGSLKLKDLKKQATGRNIVYRDIPHEAGLYELLPDSDENERFVGSPLSFTYTEAHGGRGYIGLTKEQLCRYMGGSAFPWSDHATPLQEVERLGKIEASMIRVFEKFRGRSFVELKELDEFLAIHR